MIKNILFDMGNVLLDYNPKAAMQMLGIGQEAQAIILSELFGGPEWVQRDLGLISVDELYEGVRQRVPEKFHAELKKCCKKWDVCMVPLDGAKEFLKFLYSDAGLKAYANAVSKILAHGQARKDRVTDSYRAGKMDASTKMADIYMKNGQIMANAISSVGNSAASAVSGMDLGTIKSKSSAVEGGAVGSFGNIDDGDIYPSTEDDWMINGGY